MTEEDSDPSEKAPDEPAVKAASDESSGEGAAQSASAAAPETVSSEAEPTKKKKGKKKKRSAPDGAASEARPALDAQGRDRPAFLLTFPHDPELETLISAFESGNYARVRELAPRLAEQSERPEVKAAAEELLERIDPDPLVKFLLAVAVLLFCVVVLLVYHSHG